MIDSTTSSGPTDGPDHVVVLGYGQEAGATAPGRPRVAAFPVGPDGEGGMFALLAVLAACPADSVVLVHHDDVVLSPHAADRLAAAVRGGATYAVPYTNDIGTDHSIGILPAGATPSSLEPYEAHVGAVGVVESIGTFRPVCVAAHARDFLELVARRPHDPLSLMADVAGDTVAVGGAVAAHDNRCVDELLHLGRTADGPVLVANLIVRDEENNIVECLESVAGLVDRIEVADTGSDDRTVELIESRGITPVHREWRDDFGWARNEVLEHSRDADWVLWIDADERATVADPVLLRGYLHAFAAELDVMELYIHNVNDFDESDSFLAPRLLNARTVSFEGALHERPVRRKDGSLDLRHAPCGLIELRHFGYQAAAVSAKGKAERNLDVARVAYQKLPSAKNALDLARSLTVNPGSDPDEITALYREGLDGIAPHSHRELAWVRGLLGAHLLATVGDPEGALAEGEAGIALVPDDWGCRAVAASALNRLERPAELVELHERLSVRRSLRPMTRGRAFRARYLRELAAARLAVGDIDAAWDSCCEAAEHGGYQTHEEIALALSVAAGRRGDLVTNLAELVAVGPAPSDRLGVVSAIVSTQPNDLAADVVRRVVAECAPDPDVLVIGIVVDAAAGGVGNGLVEHLGVLDDERRRTLHDRLTRMGRGDLARSAIGTVRAPVSAAVGRREDGPARSGGTGEWGFGRRRVVDARAGFDRGVGEPAEIVVLDSSADRADWVALGDLIDPAGAVIALPGAPPPPQNWFLERSEPGFDVYRREWSHDDLVGAADRLSPPELAEVVVHVVGPVGPELCAWMRCCLPSSMTVAVVGIGEVEPRPDAVSLVVPADVLPEPGWVQFLVDAAVAGRAVGCSLMTTGFEVVHAGCLADGRPVGAGIPARANPFVLADAVRRLAPPFAVPAGHPIDFGPDAAGIVGDLQGGIVATVDRESTGDRESAAANGTAGWRECVGDSVVVVCEDDVRRLAVVDAVRGEGLTPLVWLRSRASTAHLDRLARSGAVVLANEVIDDAPLKCSLAQLVGASQPRAVVTDDDVMVADDYDAVARSSVRSRTIWVGSERPDIEQRIDVITSPDALGGEFADHTWPEHRPEIPAIDPIEPQAGMVSIIIPVYGKVELTLACLGAVRATVGRRPCEIIVVDDASPDDTVRRLTGLPDVRVVSNPTNLGFPGAVNQGLAAARGEFVCVLNNDTEPAAGWLDEMMAALAEPGTEMVAPRSNSIAGRQLVLGAPELDNTGRAHAWAAEFRRRHGGTTFETLNLKGMCLLARRRLFERLGGLDEGFGRGNGEDDELCDRVIGSGGRLRVANGAVVLHHGSATFREIEIDYGVLLRRANRCAGRRLRAQEIRARLGVTGVILSDGDVAGSMLTVESAWPFVDRLIVIERAAPALTELAMGTNPAEVSVRRADWRTDGVGSISGLPGSAALVLVAGDEVHAVDPGVAKAELDRHAAVGAHIDTERGPSGRFLPIGDAGQPLDPSRHLLTRLRLTR